MMKLPNPEVRQSGDADYNSLHHCHYINYRLRNYTFTSVLHSFNHDLFAILDEDAFGWLIANATTLEVVDKHCIVL